MKHFLYWIYCCAFVDIFAVPKEISLKKSPLLPGFNFLGAYFGKRKERRVLILEYEQTKESVECKCCGHIQNVYYDSRKRLVRHIDHAEFPEIACYLLLPIKRLACVHCGELKQERISFLAGLVFYTKDFMRVVGRACKKDTVTRVAELFNIHWHSAKKLDREFLTENFKRKVAEQPKKIIINTAMLHRHNPRAALVLSDGKVEEPLLLNYTSAEKGIENFLLRYANEKQVQLRTIYCEANSMLLKLLKKILPSHIKIIVRTVGIKKFVQKVQNKITSIINRARGFRDLDYLCLKILA